MFHQQPVLSQSEEITRREGIDQLGLSNDCDVSSPHSHSFQISLKYFDPFK